MVPVLASAASFQVLEQNVTYLGQAYAGTAASVENASAAYYNPAGITENKGWNFSSSNAFLLPSTSYTLTSATVGGSNISPLTTEQDAKNNFIPVPQLFVTKDYGDKLAFAFSVNSPFGLKSEYPLDSSVKYWAVRSQLQTINLSTTTAYKVTSNFSVGVGMEYSMGSLALAKYLVIPDVFSGVLDNKLTGQAWGWHAGLFYKSAQVDLGFRFNSMLNFDLSGNLYGFSGTTSITSNVKSPEVYVFSANYHLTQNDNILLDVQSTNWERVKQIDLTYTGAFATALTTMSKPNPIVIPQNYKDAARVALGYQHLWGKTSILRAGIAYDGTPSNDTDRSPAIPDNHRLWFSAGYTHKWDKSSLDFGYSFVNIAEAPIDLTDNLVGNIKGTWKSKVHIFGLQWNAEWN
jgi:long-chain fatty acid transport protein